jgi:TPR repeat protein
MYYWGKGVRKDYTRAVELYKKACDMGDGWGCKSLGGMYEYGEGVAKDSTRARELYKKACDLGAEIGCKFLKSMEGE